MQVFRRTRLLIFLAWMAGPLVAAPVAGQPAIKASSGWVKAVEAGATDTVATVVVENGTMYDVYVVGAEADVAGTVELWSVPSGAAAAPVKEVPVPAYGQLDMSEAGVHLRLRQLTRALAPGDTVRLTIHTDAGQALEVPATVK